MAGRSELPHVDALRAFAAARVAAEGLNRTARDIGVRAYGLRYFLEGGKPHRATLRKLQDWYLRTVAESSDRLGGEAEEVALNILVRDVPAGQRAQALRLSVGLYEQLFDTLGIPRPPWLRRLHERRTEPRSGTPGT